MYLFFLIYEADQIVERSHRKGLTDSATKKLFAGKLQMVYRYTVLINKFN